MNLFKQFIVSLFSPKDIASFGKQRMGKTILYVLLLTLLSLLPTFYYFSTSITAGVEALQDTVKNDLPSFTIKDGELISDQSVPLTINKNDFTIIFDSTNAVAQTDIERSDNTLFFLKNEMVYSMAGQSQSVPYTMLGNATFTKDDFVSFISSMNSILSIFIPITSAVIYLFTFISKLIEVSVLALIGLALKNILGKTIEYGQLWKLSAYSITLPTVFFTIMESLKTTVPSGFFIHWFVSIIMLVLILKEFPSTKTE